MVSTARDWQSPGRGCPSARGSRSRSTHSRIREMYQLDIETVALEGPKSIAQGEIISDNQKGQGIEAVAAGLS
jgi:hypothetical protein